MTITYEKEVILKQPQDNERDIIRANKFISTIPSHYKVIRGSTRICYLTSSNTVLKAQYKRFYDNEREIRQFGSGLQLFPKLIDYDKGKVPLWLEVEKVDRLPYPDYLKRTFEVERNFHIVKLAEGFDIPYLNDQQKDKIRNSVVYKRIIEAMRQGFLLRDMNNSFNWGLDKEGHLVVLDAGCVSLKNETS